MTTTETRPTLLLTDPVLAAGALRMMARHLVYGIRLDACPERLHEVVAQSSNLLSDAIRLGGRDHADRDINRRIGRLHLAATGALTREARERNR